MEKIKINGNTYDLVADGYQIGADGGRIIFRPGTSSFAAIEADLIAARDLTVLDSTSEPMISRTDLVYAGQLTKDSNHVVGSEQVQDGVDEVGDPVYATQDVIGTVMIAVFRSPDVREQLKETNAKIEYMSMMAGIEMEG